jgi:hypothetical protein
VKLGNAMSSHGNRVAKGEVEKNQSVTGRVVAEGMNDRKKTMKKWMSGDENSGICLFRALLNGTAPE